MSFVGGLVDALRRPLATFQRGTFAMAAIVGASCLLATACDPPGNTSLRLINGCDHEVSVWMSETNSYLMSQPHSEKLRLSAVPLAAGETKAIRPIHGQTLAVEAIVYSDTDSVQVGWGEDLDKPNDYTLSGAECLPSLSGAVKGDPSDASPTP